MSDGKSVAVLLLAAGRGERASDSRDVRPKQYRPLAGGCAVSRVVDTFHAHPRIDRIILVTGASDTDLVGQALGERLGHVEIVPGGATRQASVFNGLEALAANPPQIVLVHDAARPFVSAGLIDRAIAAGAEGAAVPAVPVTDTVVSVSDTMHRESTLDRGRLRAVQTPQAFPYDLLRTAHLKAAAAGLSQFTDDGALVEHFGHRVKIFEGEPRNMKLTTAEDVSLASRYFQEKAMLADVRTGSGFDVHAFGPGDSVVLGGVTIPHTQALTGHSDADVVLHALTDAILGALGEGDIGEHFPPSDMTWQGADSRVFFEDAVGRVGRRNGIVANLDVTVICEAPRIGPHREALRARIAALAGLSPDRVNVKATTTERLGFAGRKEGIAALASATIRLP